MALVAASAGQFLGALDITVNVALPEITRYFSLDALTVQWIIILYIGSTTGLQMSLGRAADAYAFAANYHTNAVSAYESDRRNDSFIRRARRRCYSRNRDWRSSGNRFRRHYRAVSLSPKIEGFRLAFVYVTKTKNCT